MVSAEIQASREHAASFRGKSIEEIEASTPGGGCPRCSPYTENHRSGTPCTCLTPCWRGRACSVGGEAVREAYTDYKDLLIRQERAQADEELARSMERAQLAESREETC